MMASPLLGSSQRHKYSLESSNVPRDRQENALWTGDYIAVHLPQEWEQRLGLLQPGG